MTDTVLITGISGYVGLHCASLLLQAGYTVRGTVRSSAKEQEVRETMATVFGDTSNLEFVHLDLTRDQGWDEALAGCSYALHVASPFVIANPKDEAEMITPAVDGTLRVLRAAKKAGVQRVVLTSTILAMMGSLKKGIFGPSDWTQVESADISTYTKSKTLAEQAAWDFIENQNDPSPMELVCIHPGGVFGPPLGNNVSGQSMTMMRDMIAGKMPMVPNVAFPMVDVRDVAQLHLSAMTHPEAAGLRVIASHAKGSHFAHFAKILNEHGYNKPSPRIVPSFLLRFAGLFDREARGMRGLLEMNLDADNSMTRQLFGWTPRPLEQSLVETAAALTHSKS